MIPGRRQLASIRSLQYSYNANVLKRVGLSGKEAWRFRARSWEEIQGVRDMLTETAQAVATRDDRSIWDIRRGMRQSKFTTEEWEKYRELLLGYV